MADEKPNKIDRRSLLTGAAIGAGSVAALAAGGAKLQDLQRKFATPHSVAEGAPAQVELSFADSHPAYEAARHAPAGAPNIITIILDDVGFSDLGCYGSEIPTPHFDALAAGGLRYANFRTTAMCSPTRAAFQTGLNHHSAGMGWLADIDSGYPGYRGDLTHDAATIAVTAGMNLTGVLALARAFRETDQTTPLVLMGYLNPLLSRGLETFAADAASRRRRWRDCRRLPAGGG